MPILFPGCGANRAAQVDLQSNGATRSRNPRPCIVCLQFRCLGQIERSRARRSSGELQEQCTSILTSIETVMSIPAQKDSRNERFQGESPFYSVQGGQATASSSPLTLLAHPARPRPRLFRLHSERACVAVFLHTSSLSCELLSLICFSLLPSLSSHFRSFFRLHSLLPALPAS